MAQFGVSLLPGIRSGHNGLIPVEIPEIAKGIMIDEHSLTSHLAL